MLLNKERALAQMKDHNLLALIATQPENVTYLTDYENWWLPGAYPYRGITLSRGFQNYAVLTSDGARGLVIHSLAETTQLTTYGWELDDVYIYGSSFARIPDTYDPQPPDVQRWVDLYQDEEVHVVDAVTGLTRLLKKRGINRGRVGIEFANLAPNAADALAEEFDKVEFVDCGELLAFIRYVKTPDELARLRHAAEINERALELLLREIRPGVTELSMRRLYRSFVAKEDGVLDFFTCAGGMRAGMWGAPSNRAYKPGDHVIIDVGCGINCYHADTGACAVLGEPSPKQKQMWNGMNEVWDAGVAALRPGTRPSELYDVMAGVQEKVFGHVGGYFSHGIGIEAREGPFANRVPGKGQRMMDIGADHPYEPGMVILIEIPTPVIGFGGVHREETFLITARGNQPLIHTYRDLYSLSV